MANSSHVLSHCFVVVVCVCVCDCRVNFTQAVVGGIFAPFETPLGVLYDELKYCDMYM